MAAIWCGMSGHEYEDVHVHEYQDEYAVFIVDQ